MSQTNHFFLQLFSQVCHSLLLYPEGLDSTRVKISTRCCYNATQPCSFLKWYLQVLRFFSVSVATGDVRNECWLSILHVCTRTHTPAHAHTPQHTHIRTQTFTHIHTHTCTNTPAHTQIYMRTHTHTQTYTYTTIYILKLPLQ